MKWKVNKVITKFILLETSILILYFVLLKSVDFKDYYTPFVLSFMLINLSIFLYSVFSKIYKTEKRVSKVLFYSVINISYCIVLSIFVSVSILKISYFQNSKLDIQDIYWIIILLISVSAANYLSALKEKVRRLELEKELQNLNMELLRAKLNPHFVFNTFNFLAEALRQNPQRAEEFTLRVSDYYREVLKFKKQWSLLEELKFIEKYLEIQREMLLPIKFEYKIATQEKVKDVIVPSGITQPVVENAIKYGIKINSGGIIEIRAGLENENVRIDIFNTGTPQREIKPEHFGTGLSIVSQQLSFIEGKISVNVENGLTIFSIHIPLIKSH
ncbi:sensor histidine kinase [Fervidobacterium sp.]